VAGVEASSADHRRRLAGWLSSVAWVVPVEFYDLNEAADFDGSEIPASHGLPHRWNISELSSVLVVNEGVRGFSRV
jgi:hypothetical protein